MEIDDVKGRRRETGNVLLPVSHTENLCDSGHGDGRAMMINANQWRAGRKLLFGKKDRIGSVEEEFGLDLMWKMLISAPAKGRKMGIMATPDTNELTSQERSNL